jgi:hypothetical protein
LPGDLKFDNPYSMEKYTKIVAGVDTIYRRAKKNGVKIAFVTDLLFDLKAAATEGDQLARLKK